MKRVGRRTWLILWVLTVLMTLWCAPIVLPLQAEDGRTLFIARARSTERTPPRVTWGDELARTMASYLTAKYPEAQVEPYTQTLDRIRKALHRGNRWEARRETGVLLKMLTDRAYGLERDAARDLMGLAQRVIPEDEFGIVFPGSIACRAARVPCP